MEHLKITDVRALPGDSAFLLDDGETAVLYDTGFGFTASAVAENIRKALGERRLDYILLTHSHYDHALGSAYIARAYPDVKIVASGYADQIFRKPSARAAMGELDRKAAGRYGVAHGEDLAHRLRVDIAVEDGDTVACGNLEFTVAALPGHTRCSVGYYLEQEQLLLGCETLGVRFGADTYLPSCLVGYRMTLDSIRRARELGPRRILLPHWGLAEGPDAKRYLEQGEKVCRETARLILAQLREGRTREQIVDLLAQRQYGPHVEPIYPIDAYRLNTGLMVALIERELAEHGGL